ncbi:MAG: Fic family protein [Patescibacteria group bacterium]
MTKERRKFLPLTSENICEIYNLLHSEGLISFPATPESVNKIQALVANINGSNFGVENYVTDKEKVVAYLYFLIKNHPFVDGNKRTAVLVFLVLSRMNDLETHLNGYDLDALAVFLESVKNNDHHYVIKVVSKTIFI